jgi:hypothetical protein
MPGSVGVRFAALHRCASRPSSALTSCRPGPGRATPVIAVRAPTTATRPRPSAPPGALNGAHVYEKRTPGQQPSASDDRRSQRNLKRREIWKDERWALCSSKTCGHVDLYPVGVSLTGKGSSSRDPLRLQNQRCKLCKRVLGRGAHRRARAIPLETRKAMRKLHLEMAGATTRVAAIYSAAGRGSHRSHAETPAETSAARVAGGASRRPPSRYELQQLERAKKVLQNARELGWLV